MERGRKVPLLSQPLVKNLFKTPDQQKQNNKQRSHFLERNMIKYGLDWISKTWTGLIKHRLIKHELIKHGFMTKQEAAYSAIQSRLLED